MKYFHPNTFADRLFYLFDTTLQRLNNFLKAEPFSFVDIVTAENKTTLVMNDGSLLTAIRINGSSVSIMAEEYTSIVSFLHAKFQSHMKDGSQYARFYFDLDFDDIAEEVRRVYSDSFVTSNQLGLNLSDLLEEEVEVLSRLCHIENSYLLLYSNHNGMTHEEKKILSKELSKEISSLPNGKKAQPIAESRTNSIIHAHNAYVDVVCHEMSEINISVDVLNCHEFLKVIRKRIAQSITSDDWKPILPGDNIPMTLDLDHKADYSGMMWPSLNKQIFPILSNEVGNSAIKIGDKLFSPITVELQQRDPTAFQSLFKAARKEKIPLMMNDLIKGNGMSVLSFKSNLASFFSSFPMQTENKKLVEIQKQLQVIQEKDSDIVQIQTCFCTWAPSGKMELLRKRTAKLIRLLQSWGGCEAAPVEGDILQSMMSSTPGAMLGSVGNLSAVPLQVALQKAPITRPGSHWLKGSMPFRTPDGKLFPYEPFSSQQDAMVTTIVGAMGSGKSVFMNSWNMGLILKGGISEIPFISIIDVGPSSKGSISLTKAALPVEKKHLALYERIKNTKQYTINAFDTRLGLRSPLPTKEEFLVSFLCFLATPDDADSPPDGIQGLSREVIRLAYQKTSQRKSAKLYQEGVDYKIDKLIHKLGKPEGIERLLWWDVVDYLYIHGYTNEATKAQRHAVPVLDDIAKYVNSSSIKSIYGKNRVQLTNEPLIDFFWRKITEAISEYPILSGTTQFDLGEARIVSLDLDEVAKGYGAGGDRKVGLIFLLSTFILTDHLFTGHSDLKHMSKRVGIFDADYTTYHKKFFDSIKNVPKRFCIDEKHRFNSALLSGLEERIIREGRKWEVEFVQSSQSSQHFSPESIKLSTNVIIMGRGSAASRLETIKAFGLNESMSYHLEYSLKRPNKDGAAFLGLFETKRGKVQQVLVNTKGPSFLWATNTTPDDTKVRDKLYDELGEVETRKLLTKLYPSASVAEQISIKKEKLAKLVIQNNEGRQIGQALRELEDDTPDNIIDEIVQEAIQYYRQNYVAVA